MPQNELLDLLLDCFTQFKYWHLKTLKAKLNQPEAFLKETLDKVAVLTRSGTHNLTYQLREDANIGHYDLSNVKLETAPEIVSDGLEDVGGTEDDDENVKMEDVLPR